MTRNQMNNVLRRLNVMEAHIDTLEKKSDKAYETGDRAKADKLERMQYEECLQRNGIVECMRILGFRVEPETGTGKWMCNIHDEMKLF